MSLSSVPAQGISSMATSSIAAGVSDPMDDAVDYNRIEDTDIPEGADREGVRNLRLERSRDESSLLVSAFVNTVVLGSA